MSMQRVIEDAIYGGTSSWSPGVGVTDDLEEIGHVANTAARKHARQQLEALVTQHRQSCKDCPIGNMWAEDINELVEAMFE